MESVQATQRFTVPMEPQPHKDVVRFDPDGAFWRPCLCFGSYPPIEPPHRPGDRIPVREEWRWDREPSHYNRIPIEDARRVLYEADLDDDGREILGGFPHFEGMTTVHPAETMPDWAVRRWATVQSCVPEQSDGVWRWAIEAT